MTLPEALPVPVGGRPALDRSVKVSKATRTKLWQLRIALGLPRHADVIDQLVTEKLDALRTHGNEHDHRSQTRRSSEPVAV